MATDTNVAAVRRFWEGFNAHDLDVWDQVCSSTFVNHDPGLPTPDADLPTLKQVIGGLQTAFPDLQSSEDDLLAVDDRVAVRRTLHGTHRGQFMGIAPTGRQVTLGGIWLARLRDGKLDEQWVYFDTLGLLRQIGAVTLPT